MKDFVKVLFIGHDASRTGAPLLLLEIIKWLNSNSRIEPAVLLKRGGVLEADYRAVAPTRCLEHELGNSKRGLLHRLLRKLRLRKDRKWDPAEWYPSDEYAVVYSNTIDTTDLAMQLVCPGRRLIQHIHELGYSTEFFHATETLRSSVVSTDTYIAASRAVRDFLIHSVEIPSSKIQVVHEFPIAKAQESDQSKDRDGLRVRLAIPSHAFVIGMCGLPQWRKGTDLFVQLALHVNALIEPGESHFLWLGGDTHSQREAMHDVSQLGLQDIFHFIPAVTNPEAYFSAFDVFALTSREDPFSVAMLEAAMSGLPVVCFAGGGGAPELVENDAGIIVPYLDVPAMARACVDLLKDAECRKRLGDNARLKVLSHYTLEKQGPKIRSILESSLSVAQGN